jgi:hypothetical protein
MSKRQYTPKERFQLYLEKMLRWQRLPRGSAERARAFVAWLNPGGHKGDPGGESKPISSTEEGRHSKQQRDGWRLGWCKRIEGDPELTKVADEAGVLDTPRPDALPGDFANPDPRVYKPILRYPSPRKDDAPQEAEKPQPSVAEVMRSWRPKKR